MGQGQRWRDCRSAQAKREAMIAALSSSRTMTEAAALLDVRRPHLYQLLQSFTDDSDVMDAVRAVRGTDALRVVSGTAGVSASQAGPLTYGRRGPTLRPVSTAEQIADETPVDREIRVAMDLPESLLHRLEEEALRRKHQHGGRMAKSPIVVEALRRFFADKEPKS